MIAKGVPHAQGARLARYLITGKDRERAELLELRGFALPGIVEAFRSVHVMARATKCVFPFFHVSVRMPEGEALDAAQWTTTADTIEQSLGLDDQPRAIAFHTCEKTGESHMHVAWSRIDQDSLTAKPLPFFKERLKRVCRELEKQFGLTQVPSARKGAIEYAPTRREEEQSRRLGIDLRDHREILRAYFERSDCGRSFQRAIEEQGMVLARGERRDYLAMDRAGGIHALGKRILGMSAAKIRARFADLASDSLPTVEEARQLLRSPPARRAIVAPEPVAPQQVIPDVEGKRTRQAKISARVQVPPVAKNVFEASLPAVPEPAAPQQLKPAIEEKETQFASTSAEIPVQIAEETVSVLVLSRAPEPQVQFTAPEPISAPTDAADTVPNRGNSRGLAAVLKQQFQAAVKAVFKRALSPQPEARRRKSGETVSTFRLAARRLLRPIAGLPVIGQTIGFLNDALPWLHLWEWNDSAETDIAAEAFNRDDTYSSPHP